MELGNRINNYSPIYFASWSSMKCYYKFIVHFITEIFKKCLSLILTLLYLHYIWFNRIWIPPPELARHIHGMNEDLIIKNHAFPCRTEQKWTFQYISFIITNECLKLFVSLMIIFPLWNIFILPILILNLHVWHISFIYTAPTTRNPYNAITWLQRSSQRAINWIAIKGLHTLLKHKVEIYYLIHI